MSVKDEIVKWGNLPRHVAIIMDGNGRWAKNLGKERAYGHYKGIDAVRRIVEGAGEIGLEYLTLYTFSIENWNRPKTEIDALMELMVDAIMKETDNLVKDRVRVSVIGNVSDLPEKVQRKLEELMSRTQDCTGLNLVLALSYGARWEILQAARQIALAAMDGTISDPTQLSEADFERYLCTKDIPDPDLLIRTGGECRLSNFLLWQCAYTEFYFIDKFWPDFEKEDLYLAIRNFLNRERRFGKTGEQVKG